MTTQRSTSKRESVVTLMRLIPEHIGVTCAKKLERVCHVTLLGDPVCGTRIEREDEYVGGGVYIPDEGDTWVDQWTAHYPSRTEYTTYHGCKKCCAIADLYFQALKKG